MSQIIIAISGKQRSGKDTLARLLAEQLDGGFQIRHLAQGIKEQYAREAGIPHAQMMETIDVLKNDPAVRRRLIEIGREEVAKDETVWCKRAVGTRPYLIIPDTRMPHEIDYFERVAQTVVRVRVYADRQLRAERGVLSNEEDYSECALDEYLGWDFVIHNNGSLEELRELARGIADYVVELEMD